MEKLNLPLYSKDLKMGQGQKNIFDPCRKKHVALTPEEWVRQNFIWHMHYDLNFPLGLLSVEMALNLNGLTRRCDIVAFNQSGKANAIIECKAPKVKITQDAFTQIATYNIKLQVDFLIITNGLNHYCCKMDYKNNSFSYLQELPKFSEI